MLADNAKKEVRNCFTSGVAGQEGQSKRLFGLQATSTSIV